MLVLRKDTTENCFEGRHLSWLLALAIPALLLWGHRADSDTLLFVAKRGRIRSSQTISFPLGSCTMDTQTDAGGGRPLSHSARQL